jgi:hypothetical protein
MPQVQHLGIQRRRAHQAAQTFAQVGCARQVGSLVLADVHQKNGGDSRERTEKGVQRFIIGGQDVVDWIWRKQRAISRN